MHYLAGIYLSPSQRVETLVVATTIVTLVSIVSQQRKWLVKATKEGGKVTSMPTTFLGQLVTPIHGITTLAIPLLYLAAVLSNGMRQPEWYQRASLDTLRIPIYDEAVVWYRVAASLCILGTIWVHKTIVDVLGKQLHFIGPRENGEVVSTGPYSVIRHPIYSTALAQCVCFAIAYWSWAPLVSLGICVGAFVYKISVEEQLIVQDPRMGPKYHEYKKKVPYQIIPYIW